MHTERRISVTHKSTTSHALPVRGLQRPGQTDSQHESRFKSFSGMKSSSSSQSTFLQRMAQQSRPDDEEGQQHVRSGIPRAMRMRNAYVATAEKTTTTTTTSPFGLENQVAQHGSKRSTPKPPSNFCMDSEVRRGKRSGDKSSTYLEPNSGAKCTTATSTRTGEKVHLRAPNSITRRTRDIRTPTTITSTTRVAEDANGAGNGGIATNSSSTRPIRLDDPKSRATGSGTTGIRATGTGTIGIRATGTGPAGARAAGTGATGIRATGTGAIGVRATGTGAICEEVVSRKPTRFARPPSTLLRVAVGQQEIKIPGVEKETKKSNVAVYGPKLADVEHRMPVTRGSEKQKSQQRLQSLIPANRWSRRQRSNERNFAASPEEEEDRISETREVANAEVASAAGTPQPHRSTPSTSDDDESSAAQALFADESFSLANMLSAMRLSPKPDNLQQTSSCTATHTPPNTVECFFGNVSGEGDQRTTSSETKSGIIEPLGAPSGLSQPSEVEVVSGVRCAMTETAPSCLSPNLVFTAASKQKGAETGSRVYRSIQHSPTTSGGSTARWWGGIGNGSSPRRLPRTATRGKGCIPIGRVDDSTAPRLSYFGRRTSGESSAGRGNATPRPTDGTPVRTPARNVLRRTSAAEDLRTPPAPLRRNRPSRLLHGIRLNDPSIVEEAVMSDEDPNECVAVPPALNVSRRRPGRQLRPQVFHPLLLAVRNSTPRVVRRLLDCGAAVNAVDCLGQNSMHILLLPDWQVPHELMCFERLQSGRRQGAQTTNSNYSSHEENEERQRRYSKTAALLCQHGVDLERQNSEGKTPVDLAYEWLEFARAKQAVVEQSSVEKGMTCVDEGGRRTDDDETEQGETGIHEGARRTDVLSERQLTAAASGRTCNNVVKKAFIPFDVLDVVLAHVSLLKLEAIAPIVGVNVGGISVSKGKRETRRNRMAQLNHEEDGNDEMNGTALQNELRGAATDDRSMMISTPAAVANSGVPSSQNENLFPGPTTCSIVCHPLGGLAPDPLRLPSPASSNLHIPACCTPTLGVHAPHWSSRRTPTTTQRSSCRRRRMLSKLPPQCEELADTLIVTGSPSWLHHPALAGIWEFLGAQLFPSGGEVAEQQQKSGTSPPQAHAGFA